MSEPTHVIHRVGALVAATALALVGATATTASAQPPGTPAIPLNNEQETTGATGGGHGFFAYQVEGDQLCYTLEVTGLTANTAAAHIHRAPREQAGGVVVPLQVEAATEFTVTACTTADPALLADIAADPRAYYVNVHTPTYPGGEVRGQLK